MKFVLPVPPGQRFHPGGSGQKQGQVAGVIPGDFQVPGDRHNPPLLDKTAVKGQARAIFRRDHGQGHRHGCAFGKFSGQKFKLNRDAAVVQLPLAFTRPGQRGDHQIGVDPQNLFPGAGRKIAVVNIGPAQDKTLQRDLALRFVRLPLPGKQRFPVGIAPGIALKEYFTPFEHQAGDLQIARQQRQQLDPEVEPFQFNKIFRDAALDIGQRDIRGGHRRRGQQLESQLSLNGHVLTGGGPDAIGELGLELVPVNQVGKHHKNAKKQEQNASGDQDFLFQGRSSVPCLSFFPRSHKYIFFIQIIKRHVISQRTNKAKI